MDYIDMGETKNYILKILREINYNEDLEYDSIINIDPYTSDINYKRNLCEEGFHNSIVEGETLYNSRCILKLKPSDILMSENSDNVLYSDNMIVTLSILCYI